MNKYRLTDLTKILVVSLMVVSLFTFSGAPARAQSDEADAEEADQPTVAPQPPGGRRSGLAKLASEEEEAPAPVARRSAPAPGSAAKRIRVGVLSVENQAPQLPGNFAQSIESVLITEATKRPEWSMLDRVISQDVLLEQKFSNSSMVQAGTGPRKGRNLGAQLLIKGIVTEFNTEARGNGQGINLGYFNIANGGTKHKLGMDIRLIDAATGQVLASENKSIVFGEKATAVALSGINLPGIGLNNSKKSSATDAIRKIVNACLDSLVEASRSVRIDTPAAPQWEGQIAQVTDEAVYIKGGADQDIQVGQKLRVFHASAAIKDPETGEVIGAAKSKAVATLEVVEVQAKISVCTVVSGTKIAVKDRVRPVDSSVGRTE